MAPIHCLNNCPGARDGCESGARLSKVQKSHLRNCNLLVLISWFHDNKIKSEITVDFYYLNPLRSQDIEECVIPYLLDENAADGRKNANKHRSRINTASNQKNVN